MVETWIEEFKKAWLAKDIHAVVNLFSDDVEYWETPFQRIAPLELPNIWQAILSQENIELVTVPVLSDRKQHIVRWELTYNQGTEVSQWAGVYILRLRDDGRCNYFYQVGEKA